MRLPFFLSILLECAVVLEALGSTAPALAQPACLGDQSAKETYSVYVVPQYLTSDTFARWAPFLEKLGRATGQCYDLRLSATIPEFERSLLSGQADLAFANPYHEVMAKAKQGYLPLLHDERIRLTGIIIVKKESLIRQLGDLSGKEIAFPAPNSFAASLLIRAKLAQQGIKIAPKYVKTHANVFRAVAIGDVAAGGAVNTTFDDEDTALKDQLRILDTTPSYAPHPFIANPRVPAAAREKLTQHFIEMQKDEEGRRLLEGINIPSPVKSNYAADYAPLEKLHLEKFVIIE